MLAAILVAGRSGSAITAQLGVMRVTEELDAMLVMGIPHGFRLIMPKVLALALAMPLLVVWTDAMALVGGMVAAKLELGYRRRYFLQKLPDAVPLANYWIGLGKGVVFGVPDRAGRLPFRPAHQAQYRKPRARHHDLGGDRDHGGDPGRRGVCDRVQQRGIY